MHAYMFIRCFQIVAIHSVPELWLHVELNSACQCVSVYIYDVGATACACMQNCARQCLLYTYIASHWSSPVKKLVFSQRGGPVRT